VTAPPSLDVDRPPFLQTPGLQALPDLFHGFSTRHGGVSASPFDTANYGMGVEDDAAAVEENMRRLGAHAGFDPARMFMAQQVHGADRLRVRADDLPADIARQSADVVLTDVLGICVAVRTADCVAILLADEDGRGWAAVHAGWRGTAQRAVLRAAEAMRDELGVATGSLRAAIGPAIGPCCFEVGAEVVEGLRPAVPGDESWHGGRRPDGKYFVDLWMANERMLREAGVAQVEVVRLCTSCNPEDFFSHRRD